MCQNAAVFYLFTSKQLTMSEGKKEYVDILWQQ